MRIPTAVVAVSVVVAGAGAVLLGGRRTTPDLASPTERPAPPTRVRTVAAFGHGPARFEPNLGQSQASVRFVRRGPGHLTLVEDGGFTTVAGPTHGRDGRRELDGYAVAVRFVDAAPRPVSRAEQESPGRTQYFVGRDASSWVRDVPNFARARFVDVWPGVDVVYHGADGDLEYDFVVAPGADAGRIAFDVEGAERVRVDAAGDLVVDAGRFRFRHRRPRVVETGPRGAREVACSFALDGASRVRLRLAAHDAASSLVVDPLLQVGVRAGGTSSDNLATVAAGPHGKVALCGASTSVQFLPAVGPLSAANHGQSDGFAEECTISATATSVGYCAIVGSTGDECFTDCCYGPDEVLYACGFTTNQSGCPAVHAPQTTHLGAQDAYLCGIDPGGAGFEFAGACGGGGDDLATCVCVDPSSTGASTNAVFVGLGTTSTDIPLPVTSAMAASPGGRALAILSYSGVGVPVGGTYLGGANNDGTHGLHLASTSDDGVVAAFSTTSPLVATPGAFQTTGLGTLNGFVARYPGSLSTVTASTYFGAPGVDFAVTGVAAVAGGGGFVVTGTSVNGVIPTTSNAPLPTKPGATDGAFLRLADDLRSAPLVSYVGTSGPDDVTGVALAPEGTAFFAGTTSNPTGFQAVGGGCPKVGANADLWVVQSAVAGGPFPFVSNVGSANAEFGGGFGGDDFSAPVGRNVAFTSGGIVVVGGMTLATAAEFPNLDGAVGGLIDVFAEATTITSFAPAKLRFSTLKVTKGALTDSAVSDADKLTFTAVFGAKGDGQSFTDLSVGGTGALTIEVVGLNSGSTVDSVVTDSIDFAAPGWTSKGSTRLRFNGTTESGAHAVVSVDKAKDTATITLTHLNAAFPPFAGPALVNFGLGDHEGSAVIQLAQKKPGSFTILPPLTGLRAGILYDPTVAKAGNTLDVDVRILNYDGSGASVTGQFVLNGHAFGPPSTTTIPPRNVITLLPGEGTLSTEAYFGKAGAAKLVFDLDGRRAAAATIKIGKAPPSQVVFSQTVFDFGTIHVNGSASKPLLVKNNSAQAVTIVVPVLSGDWFIFPNRTIVLQPGELKTLDFGLSGQQKGTLNISFQITGPALTNGAVTIRGKAVIN